MKFNKEQKKASFPPASGVWSERIPTLLIFASLLAITIYFINQEHFIYYWDFAGYWFRYREFTDLFLTSPLSALGKTIYSIRHDEYNLFPVLLLLPSGLVLGDSRMSYVLGNTILFILPTIVLFASFFKTRISEESKISSESGFTLAVFCLGVSPQLLVPVLCGYLGSGGLILAVGVLMIYCRKSLSDQRYSSILSMALLLGLMVVFRRWYAYWVAGFLASVTLVEITALMRKYHTNFRNYLPTFLKLFVLGSVAAGFFILMATPQAIQILTTDYGDIYSGYKFTGSFMDTLGYLNAHFGFLVLSSAGLGFLFSLWRMKSSNTPLLLFFQFWFSFLLFTNTQDMGYHHYYIVLPSLLFFSCYFWYFLLMLGRGKCATICVWGIMFILLTLNFFIVINPSLAAALNKVDSAFPQLRHFPMIRQDIGEIHNILRYLDEQHVDGDNRVYVLASGHIFNDDILFKECLTTTKKYSSCDYFATTAHVDKRDGLPTGFFQSKYIVTTDPIQIHLDPKDQQVIGLLRDMVVNQDGFGRNYRKLDVEFHLEENLRVLIYERRSEKFDLNDLLDISERFVKLYPNHSVKFLFPSDVFEQISKKTTSR